MIDQKEVGKRIREIRKLKNLKQEEFAEALNTSTSSLSELETGKHKPSTDILVKLVDTYDVNIHYVLFGNGDMFIDPVVLTATRMLKYVFNLRYLEEFLYKFERSKYLQIEIMKSYIALMITDDRRELIEKEVEEFDKRNTKRKISHTDVPHDETFP